MDVLENETIDVCNPEIGECGHAAWVKDDSGRAIAVECAANGEIVNKRTGSIFVVCVCGVRLLP